MKNNILIFSVIALLSLSFSQAIYNPNDSGNQNEAQFKGAIQPTLMNSMGNGIYKERALRGQGQILLDSGEKLNFSEQGKRVRLHIGNFSADCKNCNLTQNRSRIHVTMSNKKKAEIKIMPNTAAKRALERLRLKNCNQSSGCTIELKEVGKGNLTKMTYEMRRETRAKVLGLFKTKVNVEAEIDAETGEIIRTKKPWWASITPEDSE